MTSQALPARRRFPIDNLYLAPILVTMVLLAGQIAFGFLESWSRTDSRSRQLRPSAMISSGSFMSRTRSVMAMATTPSVSTTNLELKLSPGIGLLAGLDDAVKPSSAPGGNRFSWAAAPRFFRRCRRFAITVVFGTGLAILRRGPCAEARSTRP